MLTLFIISFVVVASMLLLKMYELKKGKPILIFQALSKFDHIILEKYHNAGHMYLDYKHKSHLFFTKQVPMHSKNVVNKMETLVQEKMNKYVGNIRGSKVLRNDRAGISEFFKNISNLEKNGSIEISEGTGTSIETVNDEIKPL